MKKQFVPFLCGVLTTLCIGGALASGQYNGQVSFDTHPLAINGVNILTPREPLVTESGASVPSSILYTDENGGGTFYVPIRPLAEALDIPTRWSGDVIAWTIEGDLAVNMLDTVETKKMGTIINDYVKEVKGIVPEKGTELFTEEHKAVENFEEELELTKRGGEYVSVTVTNDGKRNIVFTLGVRVDGETQVYSSVKVPAGESATRTYQRLTDDVSESVIPFVRVGNGEDVFRENEFTVRAVQFKGE